MTLKSLRMQDFASNFSKNIPDLLASLRCSPEIVIVEKCEIIKLFQPQVRLP